MNTIVNATLYHIQMKLKSPFTASYGSVLDRDFILVELCDNSGLSGWGECSAFSFPWYTEETIKTAWHMLEDFLIPALFKHDIAHPDQLAALFRPIRGNNMAKAALEEGHTVSMFLAGAAVTLMKEEAMDRVYGFGCSLREYYDYIIAHGGRIYLSKISCESRGMKPEDLEGKPVTLASPNDLVNLSLEHDRMFTYG